MKIIRGTQDSKGVVYQKQPEGGTGRMRCMKCGQICSATRLPNGTPVMQCGGCGATHTTAALDKPYVPPFGSVPKRLPSAGGQ